MSTSKDESAIFAQHESTVRSYCRRFPMVIERACGSYLYDTNGTRYIDFLSCAGSVNYGHNPPELKAELLKYLLSDGIQAALDMHTVAKREFIDAFYQTILKPRQMDYRLQFTGPTGTSVIESAVKLARKVTGRKNVVAFTNGFHGMSGTSLGLTGNRYHRQQVQDTHVTRIPYDGYLPGDVDSVSYLRKLLVDSSSGIDIPAAVVLETVQGEGGINVASVQWLRDLRALTSEYGILLIIDDIQAGCGRTGQFFSFEFADIQPDLVCLSKSLSGFGLPFSLLLIAPQHDKWQPAEDNGTFRGNNLAFVSATAALWLFWSDQKLQRDIQRREKMVQTVLHRLAEQFPNVIADVRGRGLFYGMECVDPTMADSIAQECLRQHLIIERCGGEDQVLKLMPALTIDDAILSAGLEIIANAVATCVKRAEALIDVQCREAVAFAAT
ncbi:diaminobutyrate--2-oxoglutarate transaminase [Pseudomonas brassicacearum]|uniref:Diaminobutyrate--2-oxoglutarate transaminase n=1 Tax=Pseudomonas brassicacearum TaxID=930166 RepID=A0A423GJL9_9PSED|nr:diaminobutyrate--2-oxoglutarate transaminase [Pseudomonas brassicacearum]ROM90329.1 diaminobutyrate--2-oxoglutarate transaminase [Pseudomonas brassicacearum]